MTSTDLEPGVDGGGPPRQGGPRRLLHRGGLGGNYYTAADEGIATATTRSSRRRGCSVQDERLPESYLDIRSAATVAIIESMIAQQCKARASTPSRHIDESYGDSTASPHPAIEEHYMTTLANYMHSIGSVVHQEPRRHR